MFRLLRAGVSACFQSVGQLRFAQIAKRMCALLAGMLFAACGAAAQNVLTQHNDFARSGGNNNETILTPSNVNTTTFGKLFSQSVDGQVYAQPLYLANLTIPGKGAHNVVFVATENDSVYAFDADNNGGSNASPLWHITLLDGAHGAASGATAVPNGDLSSADINPLIGITGTPTIDPSTNTIYVVGKTKENGTYVQRLHGLDATTGSEKFGGPVVISASVPGNGNGSSGGTLNFDPKWENNRASLLLLNGFVYLAFAAHGDNGPWHGWILSYNASTLQQTGVWCVSPNGLGGGIWMSGSGLAADNINPNGTSPGGRLFVATGNGTYDASKPYTSNMDYGDSIVRLELTNGAMKVADEFTPFNQATLTSQDKDLAAGGVLLLPDQSTGGHTHLLVQLGKQGMVYVVDRDNMGGFNGTDAVVQEFSLNGNGMWGMPGYGNGTVFMWGKADSMKAFPVNGGKLPTTPSQTTAQSAGFPSPTPTLTSANGSGPIVWTVQTDNFPAGSATLRAHDATNLNTTLYSSSSNTARDAPGPSVKFAVPTVTNGKVYVGTGNALAVFGLLNGAQQAAAPSISPAGESFTGSLSVTITDTTPGASIFYSTTGTATTSSTPYTGPITVNTTETLSAIASAPGFLQSLPVSQSYTLQTQTLMPTFSVIPGSYPTAQTVTISDASPTPTIYYAINGPASTATTPFTGSATVTVGQSETINAIATSPGLSTSPQASATYSIGSGTGINFANGFSTSASSMTFNGKTQLNDTRLQLTDGLPNEASSAWFDTPVNIQSFTNNFTFQLSNPQADGMTFTIQNMGLTALGAPGGGLGYAGIANSVAIKFDLFNNDGEGSDSTGLYTNGASPSVPAVDMTASGLNLHSGNAISASMVYDGKTLTLTLTDGVLNKTFQTSWTVNIPQIVGGNTAFVGFTGGTGGGTASQKILTWNFSSTAGGTPQAAAPTFSLAGGTYSGTQTVSLSDTTAGATILYTTDGSTPATTVSGSTKQYTSALSVGSSETINAIATASGFSPSNVATASYTITALAPAATPLITPATGTYTSAQTVSITDATAGSTIYYALNGPASTSSTVYTGAFVVNATTTVNAIATAPNFATSGTATSAITIQTTGGSTPINFTAGFTAGGLQFNGHTKLNGTRLQLTDASVANEAASAFWTTPVSITSFTNDFTFQLTNPTADGFTFTIQGVGPTALGPFGGGLGYGPDAPGGTPGIATSVAVKFDLFDNSGEGPNSTGLYTNGASPTVPATTLGGNVNLHSGDIFHVVMSYNGTTLTMTITDTNNTAQTFTTSWPINIPGTVGGNNAYVGFTGGTGGMNAVQEILTWSYSTNASGGPKTPVVYAARTLPAVSSGPTWRQLSWAGFPDGQGMILDATAVGDSITLTLNVATAGIYDVKVSMKDLNTRGIWQLAVNGTNLGTQTDEYQATGTGVYVVTDLGNFNFSAAGNYSFKFTIVGKNAASSGFSMSFDDFTLTPQ
jgi:Legume lectin domain/Chitobiase/beta-hexosaminidase C-terminal domain